MNLSTSSLKKMLCYMQKQNPNPNPCFRLLYHVSTTNHPPIKIVLKNVLNKTLLDIIH